MTTRFSLTLAAACAAWAQPGFEVASIRPSAQAPRGIQVTARTVTIRTQPLGEYLRWAYSTQLPLIIGPSWLSEVRFDTTATTTADATEAEMRLMMRALLAERFKLVLHREKRELSVLELAVSKSGHKLVPTDVEGSPNFRAGNLSVSGIGATVEPLVETISGFLQTPVLDRTGLQGRYNYELEIRSFITDDVRRNAAVELPVVIGQALQEQVGLKMVSAKALVEVLIVDHIDNQPTEN